MKKSFIFVLPCVLSPLVITSCTIKNPNTPSSSGNNPNEIQLSFPDYFTKFDQGAYDNRNQIKNQITTTINKYRLKEWNEYYQNKGLSQVLNINLSDYDKKAEGAQDFDWSTVDASSNIATNIYNNQDKQFQYMNDFINLINNENSKNQEDFLYLRWLYYSLFGAKLYQLEVEFPFVSDKQKNNKVDGKPLLIKNVKITNWIEAISKIIVELNPQDLFKLIYTFCTYYGIVPNLNQFKEYFEDLQNELKKPGELIQNLTNKFNELANELGLDGKFWDDMEDFYNKVKDQYEKIHNKKLSFKEFLKDFKNIINEFKDLKDEFKDIINKWESITTKEGILELIEEFENILINAIPEIKPPDFLADMKIIGLQNSVLHAKLCAQDMLMRLLSKRDLQDSNYKIWQKKKERAFNIYKKMVDYNNLLINSFFIEEEKLASEIVDSLLKEIEEFVNNDLLKKVLGKLVEGTLTKIAEQIFSSIKKMLTSILDKTIGELRLVSIDIKSYTDNTLEVKNVKNFNE